ncbi:MAG: ribonuclease HII [Desulfatiglans sp.]|nr:ribonuclease HII [Desulfatiglans sp.]
MARQGGYGLIAGVDEAGRGPLAGPVVAAAVIIPEYCELDGVRDSKQMTEQAREKAFPRISKQVLTSGIAVVPHTYIDEHNILKATLRAMKLAVSALDPQPEFLLVDGIHSIGLSIPQRCIKKGDQRSLSIAAASVMAKVYRDRIMRSYHKFCPAYSFDKNKGYGTSEHLRALEIYGPSPFHRLTFKRVLGHDQRET